ncbi:MAG: hypothetical protein GY772_03570 [bacterium]|nr:hypothetical protein [bacterium]
MATARAVRDTCDYPRVDAEGGRRLLEVLGRVATRARIAQASEPTRFWQRAVCDHFPEHSCGPVALTGAAFGSSRATSPRPGCLGR